MQVRPSRSVGSFAPPAWRMKVRRMPSTPPNRPASKTTLSRGEAWPASAPRCRRAGARPVVPGENEGGEVDLTGQLEQAPQRGGPGIERPSSRARPGRRLEAAGQRLEQVRLLSRRAQEYARLVHPRLAHLPSARRLFGQRPAHRAPLRDPLEIAEQARRERQAEPFCPAQHGEQIGVRHGEAGAEQIGPDHPAFEECRGALRPLRRPWPFRPRPRRARTA